MINRLIDVALKNRFIVVVVYLGLAGWGWWALTSTPIDAIPDLSDNQVIVFTDWSGHSPQEVEDQVTYPLTVNLQGLAGVRVVRSQSAFGFSMIYVIFEDNIELYFARTRVLERMSLVAKSLPAGVTPILGPDATGVGHVFWYTVESRTHSLLELRTLQDWFIRYQLNAVPGVAEVASVGGHVQQYQVDVDPNRLRTYNLPLSAVVSAVRAADDDSLDVVDGRDQSDASNDQPGAVRLEHIAADIQIARTDGRYHRAERQVVGPQPIRIDIHLVLLDVATDGGHLRDARHGIELIADEPVLQRPEITE